jgi:putative methionine-R-sulfoxide reductase with GAF domain
MVKNPLSIICHACALMTHWAGLYLAEDKDTLVAGANMMLQIALKLLNKKAKTEETKLLQDDDGRNDE